MPIQIHRSCRIVPTSNNILDVPLSKDATILRQIMNLLSYVGAFLFWADRGESDIVPALLSTKEVMSDVLDILFSAGTDPDLIPEPLRDIFRTMLGDNWAEDYQEVICIAHHVTEAVLDEIHLPEVNAKLTYGNGRPFYGDDPDSAQPSHTYRVSEVIKSMDRSHVDTLQQLGVAEEATVLLYSSQCERLPREGSLAKATAWMKGCVVSFPPSTLNREDLYPRRMHQVKPAVHEGMLLSTFAHWNLPAVLIHELMHFENREGPLESRCLDLRQHIPAIKKVAETFDFNAVQHLQEGDFIASYGFELCGALAKSAGSRYAILNADWLTCLFIMIWLMGKYPKYEWTSGKAKLRPKAKNGRRFRHFHRLRRRLIAAAKTPLAKAFARCLPCV